MNIKNLFDKLIVDVPEALAKTANDLSTCVPEKMINSIGNGIKERLFLLQNV